MPTVSQTIIFRRMRNLRAIGSLWRWLGLSCATTISLLIVALSAAGTWYYFSLVRDLPSIATLPAIFEPPDGELLQPTRLFDRSHDHVILTLQNPAAKDRQYLYVESESQPMADEFSPNLIAATIAALDPGFWNQPVFTLKGMATDASPTLAQRLVFDNLLYNEPISRRRSIQAWLLAGQTTAQYGRNKVLEWYLNSAKYGDFVYGADAAARVYLSKPATQLTISEAALLTAIDAFPELDPWSDRRVLWNHQVGVIQKMLEYGLISSIDADEALAENIQLKPRQIISSLAPAYTDLVLLQLSAYLPLERISRGGYEIITTLDYDFQAQAACIVREKINQNQESTNINGAYPGQDCTTALLQTQGQFLEVNYTQGLSAEVIVLQPQTGEILAYVGGADGDPIAATPAEHQVGSIISPFLYLTGFTHGMSPASLLWDLPAGDVNKTDPRILATYHGPVSLRTALVNDYLGAANDVLNQVGIDNIYNTESEFGIHSTSGISTSTGAAISEFFSQPVSLLDTVQAYAVLANQGVMAGQSTKAYSQQLNSKLETNSLLNVKDFFGKTWLDLSDARIQSIVSSQLAYLITNVLSTENAYRQVAENSTSLDFGRPIAVKVGSDDKGDNAWTIGYIPQMVVGVWVGSSQTGLSREITADIWKSVMEYASNELPVVGFPTPDGISQVQVCDPSGLLVTPTCPTPIDEVFLKGNEPTLVDHLYQEFLIDKQTGFLATIFTPPELVEKKVYLVVPVEVARWAAASNLPIPPTKYDEIQVSEPFSNEAKVNYPGAFAHVAGKIEITGSAAGNDFSYYRLEVGHGLNPQQWLLIGEDMNQPVQDGILATWDTTGLEGDYIVELLVIKKDLQVEHAVIPVVVDNTAPQLQIVTPNANQQFSQQANQILVFQVKATDNQAIARLEFFVDDELVSTLYSSPFVIAWPSKLGKHTLLTRVYDFAGNSNSTSITFSIVK
jgi:membrane peptidoglycan carboxypeptidase